MVLIPRVRKSRQRSTSDLQTFDGAQIGLVPVGGSGGVLLGSGGFGSSVLDYQSFTSSGTGQTWVNPTYGTLVYVRLWGGGASGGCRATTGSASGGGGGAYAEFWFLKSLFTGNKLVNVAAGGAAIASSNAVGNAGGTSAFDTAGVNFQAFGGGPGFHTAAATACYGGAGGGPFAVGNAGASTQPTTTGGLFGSIYGAFSAGGGQQESGGLYSGSGGTGNTGNTALAGGDSIYGGAGGGSATSLGVAAGGTSKMGGAGGIGGSASAAVAGTAPGGGGGGARNGQASGAGAVGRVEVFVF